ncbi:MAG: N-acetylmuramoyl-L-alanine amidase [Bacillota bacterium]|nr:N-acetylmuramoyl-L-alanine amidase [Bacillota bacterium]
MRKIKSFVLVFIFCLGVIMIHNISVKSATNQDMIMDLEKPYSGQDIYSKYFKISGWVLNSNGVKEVDIYIDDMFEAKTYVSQDRPDVTSVYKSYINGNTCGYEYTLDLGNVPCGKHVISAEAIGNDGRKKYKAVVFNKALPTPRMDIENPKSLDKVIGSTLTITGWSLNFSGVKEADVYLDNKLIGQATLGISRPDVDRVYSGYTNGTNCGYSYGLDLTKVSGGDHTISVESVGNDGSRIYKAVIFNNNKLNPLIDIESPKSLAEVTSSTLLVSGWALNNSGIKEVDAYLDSNLLGQATIGISRKDVSSVYKGYTDGDNCGYQYNIDLENVPNGKHTISVEQVGKDGSKNYKSIIVYVNIARLEPRIDIESLISGANVGDKVADISGWALCPSGVKEADVYVDSTMVGKATLGIARPDVNSVYSGYIGGINCGYDYKLDLTSLTSGKHTISIEAVGVKNEKTYKAIIIYVGALSASMDIESPTSNQIISLDSTKTINISGWALSKSPLNTAKVLVDGNFVGQATTGISRKDVNSLFPGYGVDDNCGYSLNLDISKYSNGTHTVCVQVTYKDGSTIQKQVDFQIKTGHLVGKVIVLDAGHNYGGDYGAEGNGYSETVLNMQVVMKLKALLENEGAKIVLTRNENDRSTDDLSTSLAKRINIANSSNADLFISIHHDSSSDSSVTGTSAYYSSFRPNIETQDVYVEIQENNVTIKNESETSKIGTANSGSRYKYICEKDSGFVIDYNGTRAWVSNDYSRAYDPTPSKQAITSETLADKISQNISSLGLVNRGVTDRNLYVTRYTTMPSVLVEVGFISNLNEANKISDSSFEEKVAEKIKDAVVSVFSN